MEMVIHLHSTIQNCIIVETPAVIQLGKAEYRCKGDTSPDYDNIVNAWVLWFSLFVDGTAIFVKDKQVQQSIAGRIFTNARTMPNDLTSFLTDLDDVADLLVATLNAHATFKGYASDAFFRQWKPATQLLATCKGILHTWCVESPASETILVTWLRTILVFFKKLDVNRTDLAGVIEEDFISFERGLEQLHTVRTSSPMYLRLCSRMNKLLSKTYDCRLHSDPVPHHGPGVVSTMGVRCTYEKYQSMCTDARIDYLLGKRGLRMSDYNPLLKKGCDRTNRFITVPKTWKKRRTISAEPAGLQFFQQAVRSDIYTSLRGVKWWDRRLRFSNQNRSRELALIGSRTNTYATIDLSAASDSVTLDMVKRTFGNTELCRWLLATRSTDTQCGTTVIHDVKKFAPMGSATCFPVESMIFVLISELAIRDSMLECDIYHPCMVYGDDIVVPYFATDKLKEYLSILGFSVNTEKSFTDGYFREACGIEAWNGFDVTPFRYKRLLNTGLINTSDRMLYVDISRFSRMINALYILGAQSTSRLLISVATIKVVSMKNKSFPAITCFQFSDDVNDIERGMLYTPRLCSNYHLESRSSRNYKNIEYDYQLPRVRQIIWRKMQVRHCNVAPDVSPDDLAYIEWLVNNTIVLRSDDKSISLPASQFSDSYRSTEIGYTMVPSLKWMVRGQVPSADVFRKTEFLRQVSQKLTRFVPCHDSPVFPVNR